MEISVYWWAFAALMVLVALWLISGNAFNEQRIIKEPARKPVTDVSDNEVIPNERAMRVTSLENRQLGDSKGYIPLENLVISEIPIAKAENIGHIKVKKAEREKKNGK